MDAQQSEYIGNNITPDKHNSFPITLKKFTPTAKFIETNMSRQDTLEWYSNKSIHIQPASTNRINTGIKITLLKLLIVFIDTPEELKLQGLDIIGVHIDQITGLDTTFIIRNNSTKPVRLCQGQQIANMSLWTSRGALIPIRPKHLPQRNNLQPKEHNRIQTIPINGNSIIIVDRKQPSRSKFRRVTRPDNHNVIQDPSTSIHHLNPSEQTKEHQSKTNNIKHRKIHTRPHMPSRSCIYGTIQWEFHSQHTIIL